MTLAELCYRLAQSLPKEEMFGLAAQISRAAVSMPANVAERHGWENTQSFIQHLHVAQGSLKELETHVLLAERVGLLGKERAERPIRQCEAVDKMLRLFIRSLQESVRKR